LRKLILGTPCDVLTMAETLERVEASMTTGARLHHVSLNVAKLVTMRSNPELQSDVLSSDLIGVDGAGIILAGRLTGVAVAERVAGIDLMEQVLGLCARRGFRPYFLGARADVVSAAVDVARARFCGLTFAGWRDGYYRADQELEVVADIRAARADCLFIAMPTPGKERFMKAHRESLGAPFIMGVGGSLDVLAGMTKRASPRVQRLGLEWLHRTMQEPRRLWWRYASTNAALVGLILHEWLGRIGGRLATPARSDRMTT
jgi:N-acetylglucosaminyldiphosphoundecaprenol N-acetyl-beta-D-mannosaminyltransferase